MKNPEPWQPGYSDIRESRPVLAMKLSASVGPSGETPRSTFWIVRGVGAGKIKQTNQRSDYSKPRELRPR